jgi:hypothetical protein
VRRAQPKPEGGRRIPVPPVYFPSASCYSVASVSRQRPSLAERIPGIRHKRMNLLKKTFAFGELFG